jgi:hypothetical protein
MKTPHPPYEVINNYKNNNLTILLFLIKYNLYLHFIFMCSFFMFYIYMFSRMMSLILS